MSIILCWTVLERVEYVLKPFPIEAWWIVILASFDKVFKPYLVIAIIGTFLFFNKVAVSTIFKVSPV